MSCPIPLQQALTDSLSSGIFIDTKFFAFSRRSIPGRVSNPKAVYANGAVLKQVPYFKTLLAEGFSEGAIADLALGFPQDKASYRDDYEYISDEDLEDEILEDAENSDENCTLLDPSAKAKTAQSTDLLIESPKVEVIDPCPLHTSETLHLGKVAFIQDAAFATISALVLYLYTDEIEFMPLSSGASKNVAGDESYSPKSSAKSIYRLADKYDIPRLKQRAYDAICAELPKCDIAQETFSRFSSRYPDILDAQVTQLLIALRSPDATNATNQLKEKVRKYATGALPYCSNAFVLLHDKAGLESLTQTQPNPLPALRTNTSWISLKDALTKSMTTGTFLDGVIQAPVSRQIPVKKTKLQPIFVSRLALKDHLTQIEAECTVVDSKSKDRTLWNDSYELDSDLEDEEPMPTVSLGSEKAVDREEGCMDICSIPENCGETRTTQEMMTVRTGSWNTWTSLLFMMYTENISFAPLRSQGLDVRLAGIEAALEQRPHETKPCSPKSLYALSHTIGMTSLSQLALKDLGSQMITSNIVDELFSKFTAAHPAVLAMQDSLLGKKFSTPESAELVRVNIKNMAEGGALHHADPLISVLVRLVGWKPPASLRCSDCQTLSGIAVKCSCETSSHQHKTVQWYAVPSGHIIKTAKKVKK